MRPAASQLAWLLTLLFAVLPAAAPGEPPQHEAGKKQSASSGGRKKAKKKGKTSKGGTNKASAGAKASPANLAIRGMKIVVKDATIEEMTLDEFAEWIGRETGATVVVRWRTLEEVGIGPGSMVSLKAKNISIRKLLAMAFDKLTERTPSVELAAKAEGNMIYISTRKEINAAILTRVYDVQDLMAAAPNFAGLGVKHVGSPGGAGIKTPRQLDASGREKKVDPAIEELIEAIMKHIQPLSWKKNGGKGTIRFFKGRLIVRNNIEVHQLLAGVVAPSGNEAERASRS